MLSHSVKKIPRLQIPKSLMMISDEVREALNSNSPVVALESTIITHGMPFPQNLEVAKDVEKIIRRNGGIPATVAVLKGKIRVGLDDSTLEYLAKVGLGAHKTSRRDLGYVMSQGLIGATTVSGTMVAAQMAGVDVFVTGGIGGVHREGETTMDISADLNELGRTPVAVVCAGVKSILDIGRTLEYLETQGVPVVTFGESADFPAFYTAKSGHMSPIHLKSSLECAQLIHHTRGVGLQNGVVIGVPIPQASQHLTQGIEEAIQAALKAANASGIKGAKVTPFVLDFLQKHTGGRSLEANIMLVKNNAEKGTLIARDLCLLQRVSLNQATPNGGASKPAAATPPTPAAPLQTPEATPTPAPIPTPAAAPLQTSTKKVVVFGGATVDILATLKDSNDVISNAGQVSRGFGGVGKNVAETILRFGFNPLLVSAIGKDPWGVAIKKNFETLGLSHKGLIESTKSQTAVYNSISNNKGTTLASVASMSVFDELMPEFLVPHLAEIRSSAFVCMDANLPHEAMFAIAQACEKSRTPLWFEPTSKYKCTKIIRSRALPYVNYISPTISELEEISRTLGFTGSSRDTKECSRFLLNLFPKLVIVCHHSLGVDLAYKTNSFLQFQQLLGDPKVPVVNKTGAGDTLTGAIVSALVKKMPIERAVRVGIKAAEATIQSELSVSPVLDPTFLKLA